MARTKSLLILAFLGASLAGAVPIALSVVELTKLRTSISTINTAAVAARDARVVAEKISLVLTDFTAVALEIDADERKEILPEAARQISSFLEAVEALKAKNRNWLNEKQQADLSESTQALFHSWDEITRHQGADLSSAEKTFHFLQLADSAKTARSVLVEVEDNATSLGQAQTRLAFENLTLVGGFLIASILAGFLISGGGAFKIFRDSGTTQRVNIALEASNQALKRTEGVLKERSERLVEAHRIGRMGDWSYRLGDADIWWSPQLFELLGYDPATFHTSREAVMSLYVGDSERRLLESQSEVMRTRGVKSIDVTCKLGDGWVRHFIVTSKALVENDGVVGFFGTVQDITERKQSEEQLEKLAYYDPLTGLANRALFHRELKIALDRCIQVNETGALLLLDLDRFKEVNDSLGHTAGDELLRKVGHLITRVLDNDQFLARLGGDEFAVIAADGMDTAKIETLADAIIGAVSGAIRLNGGEANIGASIGIVRFPMDGVNAGDLLRNADLALYHAKDKGRGRCEFFQLELNVAVQHKIALGRDLRQAIREGVGLAAHYQPQVDLLTGQVIGFEVLMRWNHPELGPISPTEFIPIAESSRLICDLGLWILRSAAAQGKAWIDSGEPAREIAVNVSAAQIWHSDLAADVASVLQETGLPPHLLCLELTESLLVDHASGRVRNVLKALKRLGVTLALDDFGTDYSSLGYLTQLPFDKLKVDRIFIDGVAHSARSRELLKGIVGLGVGLGMRVIGEGAETPEEVAILRALGCNIVQGYIFGRPAAAGEALALAHDLQANRSQIAGFGAPCNSVLDQRSPILKKSVAA